MHNKSQQQIKTLSDSYRGYSLIEILIVIAVIGILVAIANPTYQNYILRTKITAMRSSISSAQFAVQNDYHNNQQSFSLSNYASGAVPFTTPNSEYINSITITNGVIVVEGNAAKLHGNAIILSFTPTAAVDGSIDWYCTSAPEYHDYVPAECRH